MVWAISSTEATPGVVHRAVIDFVAIDRLADADVIKVRETRTYWS